MLHRFLWGLLWWWIAVGSAEGLAGKPPKFVTQAIEKGPWRGALETEAVDVIAPMPLTLSQGTIPADLKGTLYRNGPGRIRVGSQRYGHWFDGDGWVSALTFHGDASPPTFTGRFVRTARFEAQERAGVHEIAVPGAWTMSRGGRSWRNLLKLPTNPANTHVVHYAGRLLALCEGGAPVELDPRTLETKGEWNLKNGDVQSPVAAHSRIDPQTGHMFGFGVKVGAGTTRLNCFEADAEGRILQQHAHPLPFHTFVHDMALTENYMVFFLPPWRITSMVPFLLGQSAIGSLYEWDAAEPTMALIVDRSNMAEAQLVRIPEMSLYHVLDGMDSLRGDDNTRTLTVTVARLNGNRSDLERNFADMYSAHFEAEHQCSPVTYTFRKVGSLWRFTSMHPVLDAEGRPPKPLELPDANQSFLGKGARFFYTSALTGENEGFLDGVQVVDLGDPKPGDRGGAGDVAGGGGGAAVAAVFTTRGFGKGRYAGSPIFVPKMTTTGSSSSTLSTSSHGGDAPGVIGNEEAEAEGYVMTYVYDSSTSTGASQLFVLDAADVAGDPVAVLDLPVRVPYSFHGSWVSGL